MMGVNAVNARILPSAVTRCGPRAEGAHVCAPQQAAFISKHFHWFFGRDRYSSIIGARWTRAG